MKHTKTWIFCTLALTWMTVIFCFSSQPADDSAAMSSPIAESVVDILYPNYEEMEDERQLELLDTWTHIVRKGAHFCEYALLGVLICLAFASIRSSKTGDFMPMTILYRLVPFSAFGVGAVYAASDELHQCFVPGRSGQLSDVLLDSTGVAAGVVFICLIVKIYNACKKRCRR